MRKLLMTFVWRVQQSQAMIGIIFWGMTLTLLLHGYVGWRMADWFGIKNVTLQLIVLFFIVEAAILFFGFIYDRIFRLWKELGVASQERNPYTRGAITPKEVFYFRLWMKAAEPYAEKDKETAELIGMYKRWIEKAMEEEKWICDGVRDLENVLTGKSKKRLY
jgi:hypothetical protein